MKFSIVPSRPGDEPALRALWQDVFGDGKDFLDDFFRLIYRPGMAKPLGQKTEPWRRRPMPWSFLTPCISTRWPRRPAFRSRGLGAQVTLAAAGGKPAYLYPAEPVPAGLVRPAYGRCDRLLPPTGPGPGTQSSHFPGRVRPKPGASAAGCSPRRVSPVGVSVFLLPGRRFYSLEGGGICAMEGAGSRKAFPAPWKGNRS